MKMPLAPIILHISIILMILGFCLGIVLFSDSETFVLPFSELVSALLRCHFKRSFFIDSFLGTFLEIMLALKKVNSIVNKDDYGLEAFNGFFDPF
jgi:hypothetical protein